MAISCQMNWLVVIENEIEIFRPSASLIDIAEPMIKRDNQSKETCCQCHLVCSQTTGSNSSIQKIHPYKMPSKQEVPLEINLTKIGSGLLCFKSLLESKWISRALLGRIREHLYRDTNTRRESRLPLRNTTTQEFRRIQDTG